MREKIAIGLAIIIVILLILNALCLTGVFSKNSNGNGNALAMAKANGNKNRNTTNNYPSPRIPPDETNTACLNPGIFNGNRTPDPAMFPCNVTNDFASFS